MENQPYPKKRSQNLLPWILGSLVTCFVGAAILVPALRNLRRCGPNRSTALTHQIALASRDYMLEYGKWPTNTAESVKVDAWMVSTFLGKNPATNPRNIVFIEISPKFLDSQGTFVDEWDRPLWIRFDHDLDNYITDPLNPTNSFNIPVIVWSTGGKYPDVTNWQ